MLRANSTKPYRNESKIVDLNKKNLNTEVTVTIPQNIRWNDNLVLNEATNEYTKISTKSVLSNMADSELFVNFAKCFDQFKIMSVHWCIDITKLPNLLAKVILIVPHRQELQILNPENGHIG